MRETSTSLPAMPPGGGSGQAYLQQATLIRCGAFRMTACGKKQQGEEYHLVIS